MTQGSLGDGGVLQRRGEPELGRNLFRRYLSRQRRKRGQVCMYNMCLENLEIFCFLPFLFDGP